MEKKKYSIYLDIESLFDLRLATLLEMNPDNLDKVLSSGYHTRFKDHWDFVNMDDYKKRYREISVQKLSKASITNIGTYIYKIVKCVLESNMKGSPYTYTVELVLNCYGYDFKDAEIKNIQDGIRSLTKVNEITVISKPISEITYSYVKNRFAMIIMYQYHKWLEEIAEDPMLKEKSLVDIELIGPMLVHGEMPAGVKTEEDLFEIIEEQIKPLIRLTTTQLGWFSTPLKVKK